MSTPETLTDGTAAAIEAAAPLVRAEGLAKTFDVSPPWLNRVLERKPRQLLHAVDEASFSIQKGQTLALVGESGCGKSTVARLLVGLYQPTRGSFFFRDQDAHAVFAGRGGHHLRRSIQMIFQDPYASLNPRWRVADIIAEPLHEHGMASSRAEAQERVGELLQSVGLAAADRVKYPHQFSGGQRQRISIARALATAPEFLVCDEALRGARMKAEEWQRVLDVNLGGAYHFCRALARPFMKQRAGRIVNISSVVGQIGNAGQVNYAASKAGLIGLTKSLAKELAPRGVTVNVVAPGFIRTDMTDGLADDVKASLLASIPLGSLGEVEDVAAAVLFLLGPGGRYITGQVLGVNGGMVM